MARPRLIQLKDGEVSLSGFPKEVADLLAAHIRGFEAGATEVQNVVDVPEIVPMLDNLPHRAIGINKGVPNKLVTVAYNLETKQALVVDVKDTLDARNSSVEFKIAADKHNFI